MHSGLGVVCINNWSTISFSKLPYKSLLGPHCSELLKSPLCTKSCDFLDPQNNGCRVRFFTVSTTTNPDPDQAVITCVTDSAQGEQVEMKRCCERIRRGEEVERLPALSRLTN